MKKFCIIFGFLTIFSFLLLADNGEKEEIDYLLFLPNSSDSFVNQGEAEIQLEKLAGYLATRALAPGQISVYGYAAEAINDIEPVSLSRDRALHVINELKARGVSGNLFAAPVGYGAVDLWGGNTDEDDRSPNRRVRILVEGAQITPLTIKAAETPAETPKAATPVASKGEAAARKGDSGGFRFPWWLLLLLLLLALLLAIIFIASKKRKAKPVMAPVAAPVAVAAVPAPVPAPKPEPVAEPVKENAKIIPPCVTVLCIEEEIRIRAYELYMARNGQNGDDEGDWYIALPEVSARYQADGYKVYAENGTWWARKG